MTKSTSENIVDVRADKRKLAKAAMVVGTTAVAAIAGGIKIADAVDPSPTIPRSSLKVDYEFKPGGAATKWDAAGTVAGEIRSEGDKATQTEVLHDTNVVEPDGQVAPDQATITAGDDLVGNVPNTPNPHSNIVTVNNQRFHVDAGMFTNPPGK